MSKCNFFDILNALIDKKRTKNGKEVKSSHDDWARAVFKMQRYPFFEENLKDLIPRRSIAETSECDLKDNTKEVKKFLKNLNVPKFHCK